jgi:ABC-type polysaccharide/polyol phosphate transport system ATPase subunit
MSDVVVECHDIGKKYHIGTLQRSKPSLNKVLVDALTAPVKRVQSLRRTQLPENTGQEIWALKNITFEVYRSEVFGIIGANGSGKSTLLKIISHVVQPTEGYAITRGRLNSLLEVGTGFHEDLTGRENLYINGSILGMTHRQIDAFFDEIVQFAEIEKFIDTPIKRYSSGMRLRLAFAIAVFLRPEIMIFDEVLEVGDLAFREKCLAKINQTAAERSVIVATHNLTQIQRLCDRVMWLDRGQIAAIGDAQQVIQKFEERFLSKLAVLYNDVSHQRVERFGEDRIMLNEGWYALENYEHSVFRWATNNAQLVILNASGRNRMIDLDLEVGPGVGSPSMLLSILDESQMEVVAQKLIYGRQKVTFELPITQQEKLFFHLRVEESGNVASPGDSRILNFRVFNYDWT